MRKQKSATCFQITLLVLLKLLKSQILIVRLTVLVVASWAALLLKAWLIVTIVELCILLVARVADSVATEGTDTATDQRTFKAATALIANGTANGGTTESTNDRTRLGIRSSGA